MDSVVMDGFTVKRGQNNNVNGSFSITVNGQKVWRDRGAGFAIYNSSIKLRNMLIEENHALTGGGIFCENSSLLLENVTLNKNHGDPAGNQTSSIGFGGGGLRQ